MADSAMTSHAHQQHAPQRETTPLGHSSLQCTSSMEAEMETPRRPSRTSTPGTGRAGGTSGGSGIRAARALSVSQSSASPSPFVSPRERTGTPMDGGRGYGYGYGGYGGYSGSGYHGATTFDSAAFVSFASAASLPRLMSAFDRGQRALFFSQLHVLLGSPESADDLFAPPPRPASRQALAQVSEDAQEELMHRLQAAAEAGAPSDRLLELQVHIHFLLHALRDKEEDRRRGGGSLSSSTTAASSSSGGGGGGDGGDDGDDDEDGERDNGGSNAGRRRRRQAAGGSGGAGGGSGDAMERLRTEQMYFRLFCHEAARHFQTHTNMLKYVPCRLSSLALTDYCR
jgi:hypothetical protein